MPRVERAPRARGARGVPRLLCLGRGALPALLTAQLCIYSLFARKNLFIFRVATCQRCQHRTIPSHLQWYLLSGQIPSGIAVVEVILQSQEQSWASRNPRQKAATGTWELLGCCFCCLFIFLGEPDHCPLKVAKLILLLCSFLWFPKAIGGRVFPDFCDGLQG